MDTIRNHRKSCYPAWGIAVLCVAALAWAGCAPGDARFTSGDPAGFWFGVWHGCIAWVSFFVGLFVDSVHVYEMHNNGAWYDVGFLLGMGMATGGGARGARHGHRRVNRTRRSAEDAELAALIEAKIKRRIRTWAQAEPDEEWDAVEKKAEARLKDAVRKWAQEP